MQKSQAYFNNKAKIDKAFHRKTAYKIQFYNNQLVDKYVERYNDAGESSKPVSAVIYAELSILNKPEVYKNYNRIINSKFTSNDNFFKMLVRNKAQKNLNSIVEAEVERISKNLDYVEKVLQTYEIPTKQYQKLVNQQAEKSLANRRQILEQVAIKNNDLLVSEGLNIPSNVFSYRDLELTAQSLLRESQMTAGFEEARSINQHYLDEGKDAIYNSKVWIHTHGGKTTRHMSNHMQRVRFDEPFIVVNDTTLEIDEMMYPCDPAGSASNAFICYCEVEYENDGELESDTVNLNQSVFDIAKPEILSPTPEVTFSDTVASLKDKMPTITSLSQFLQNNKVAEYIKNNPVETVPKNINVETLESAMLPNEYLLPKDFKVENIDVVGYEHNSKGELVPVVTGEAISEYNSKISNTETVGDKIESLTENKIDNTLTDEVKVNEPIDVNKLTELDYESFDIDPTMQPELAKDIKLNEVTGKYEYKGLELHGEYEKDGYGWIYKKDVEEHNNKFDNTLNEPVNNNNIKIDTNSLYYDEILKEYTIFDNDGITTIAGKKIYKGLDVTQYYNYEQNWADIPEKVIDDFNKGKIDSVTDLTPTKEPISKNDVIYSAEDGVYLVETFKLEEINDKFYLNGLEVKVNDKYAMYQLIPEKEFKNHNKQFNTSENNVANEDGFKPIVQTKDIIHNKKSDVLDYGEDIDSQAYAVDKKTGKQYVLDEKRKYEENQDRLQNKVDMSEQYRSVNDWGHGGYSKINQFNYNKGMFEGKTYRKLRDEVHPILDEIRENISKGKSITALEQKLNKVKDKYINNGDISMADRVFRVIDEIKDIDIAMVKAPELQQDTCFIRAGAWKLEFNKIGEIFEWEGFAGITYKNRPVDLGHESLSYNITILAPKGTKGVRLSDQFDGITPEREWLLPRGQKFRVLEFDEVEHTCTIELIIDESWS